MKDNMMAKELMKGTILQAKTHNDIRLLYNALTLYYAWKSVEGNLMKGTINSMSRALKKVVAWMESENMESSEVVAQLGSAEEITVVLAFLKDTLAKMPESSAN